ncbi:hypothetical protein D3C78_435440 [compost metagenome]
MLSADLLDVRLAVLARHLPMLEVQVKDDVRPQRFQQLGEVRVVGGTGNRQVEFEVGPGFFLLRGTVQ